MTLPAGGAGADPGSAAAVMSAGRRRACGATIATRWMCRTRNGCGDTFHGAFVAAKIKGMTNEQACRYASAAAAIKCTRLGARLRHGLPTRNAAHSFRKGALHYEHRNLEKRRTDRADFHAGRGDPVHSGQKWSGTPVAGRSRHLVGPRAHPVPRGRRLQGRRLRAGRPSGTACPSMALPERKSGRWKAPGRTRRSFC